ncbi:lytic polysaccharide monooxygenase [Xylariaceae sp. FL1272]|nr:lytic polysaccharide monooxygenase [Xylariaceae sp. FL1272]
MPSKINLSFLALAVYATSVVGHGHVREVIANGISYPGYDRWGSKDQSDAVTWSFTTEDEGPVSINDINGPNIACHNGAQNAQSSVPVNAGDTVTLKWFNEIGGFEHPGPIMHYLAPCGEAGCTAVDKTELSFFKFFESGLLKPGAPERGDDPAWVTQQWATTDVHKNVTEVEDGWIDTFTVTLPRDIKAGPYILRHEMLGLHMADKHNAEFYPQCINLEISGSGTAEPEGEPASRFYTSDDPGIDIDIWRDLESYVIPGPSLYTSGVSPPSNESSTGGESTIVQCNTRVHPRDLQQRA